MAENQIIQGSQQMSTVKQIKNLLAQENYKQKFQEVLGKKASQFMATIVNVVTASAGLKKCDPNSIMAAAFVAASFDLPIDSNLGFSAIVPYDKNMKDPNGNWHKVSIAQFQIMYKGFIQLAIRTGEYERMNCSEVYEDELLSYNPIKGECEMVSDFSTCKQRAGGETEHIIGYYAWFRIKSGYTKEIFMSKDEVVNHAKKYSQAFKYDLNSNKSNSKWSTDFDAMAKKTVIKLLLSKWGPLSVDINRAVIDDQKTYDENGNESYWDNKPMLEEVQDPFASVNEDDMPDFMKDPEQDYEEIDITE